MFCEGGNGMGGMRMDEDVEFRPLDWTLQLLMSGFHMTSQSTGEINLIGFVMREKLSLDLQSIKNQSSSQLSIKFCG